MTRITKEVKKIADAYIEARLTDKGWSDIRPSTSKQVIEAVKMGHIIPEVMEQIEVRYCSITSTILARNLGHASKEYKKQVYTAFKNLLNN